jgi:hypothetical protein
MNRKLIIGLLFSLIFCLSLSTAVPLSPFVGNPSTIAAKWWFEWGNNSNGFVSSMTNLSKAYVNNVSTGGTIIGPDFIRITNVSTNPGSFIQLNGTGLNPFGKNNCTGFSMRTNITANNGNNALIGFQNTTDIRNKWAFAIETIDGGNLCGANVTWCIKAGATSGYSASSGINFVKDTWYNLTFCQDTTGANLTFYINNEAYATLNVSGANVCQNCNFTITVQGNVAGRTTYLDAKNFFSWSRINGSPQQATTPASSNLTLTVVNSLNLSSITNYTLLIEGNGQSFIVTTNNGTIPLSNLTGYIYNLTIVSLTEKGGFINRTIINQIINSTTLQANLTPLYYFFSSDYSSYLTFRNINYSRNLTYSINISCPSFLNTTLDIYINYSLYNSSAISCLNSSQVLNGSYQHGQEGNFTIYLYLNASYLPDSNSRATRVNNFTSDLNNPTITLLNLTTGNGFSQPFTNLSLRCLDTIMPNLTYYSALNGVTLQYQNHSNNFTATNQTQLTNGANVLLGNCSDYFGSTQSIYNRTAYLGYISLIDEVDNTLFNVNNASSVRVYFDTNSSYYDFKATGTNTLNFTTSEASQLRFELIYNDGSVITRYVDLTLINGEVRVCANKQGVTHYQQLIISATEQPAVLKNVFSNCVIAADYTRFAYQDALTLQSFSIASLYYLYTYIGVVQTFLASVDGSISTFINLDQLQFNQQGYNLNVLGDALTFQKSNGVIVIYYNNLAQDNTALSLTITRMDTSATVFSLADSAFTDKNEFNINFDYSTLSGINETVLFKLDLTKTNAQGATVISKYFNTNASSGGLNPFVAAVFSILLTIFGLTFASARITFSWFGIIVELGAIAILTFAVANWYITMLLGLNVIMLIFIVLILTAKNYPTLQ